jgi:hypothetical protein
MTQHRNRKYKIKGSLHVAENFRGEIIRSEAAGPSRGSKAEGSARFSQKKDPDRYQCLGFLFTRWQHVDPQEYADFWHMQWYRIELESDLKMEVLPSGLLLRSPKGEIVVVRNSALVPLDGQLQEVE